MSEPASFTVNPAPDPAPAPEPAAPDPAPASEPAAPDPAPASEPAAPISVKGSAAPVVISESTKVIGVAIFAAIADHFMRTETALVAVMAAAGVVVTAVWGLWHRLITWKALKHLANLLPDEIAKVGR